jgi:hypothetical protein
MISQRATHASRSLGLVLSAILFLLPSATSASKPNPKMSSRAPAFFPMTFVPGATWGGDGNGLIRRLGLVPNGLYIVHSSTSARQLLGDARQITAIAATVSPKGDMIAIFGRTAPSNVAGTEEGVALVDTSGTLITYFPSGQSFAWSPDGAALAVVIGATNGFGGPAISGLTVWDRARRGEVSYPVWPSSVGWTRGDSLLIQIGRRVEALDRTSGAHSITGHHATIVSPDGLYSIWRGEDGGRMRIMEDETGRDVTAMLFAPLSNEGLGQIRSAFWVKGAKADHFLCVSASDNVYGDKPACRTAIYDAGSGEEVARFDGEALGPTGDGKAAVVLIHESGVFRAVDTEGLVRAWVAKGDYH